MPASYSSYDMHIKKELYNIEQNIIVTFLDSTGVYTQSFALTRQVLYCLSHDPRLFCSGYF
jgi:hypothetical protein